MKHAKIILFVLLCILAAVSLASCDKETPPDPASALYAPDGSISFVVVRGERADKDVVSAASGLCATLGERYGTKPKLSDDFVKAGSDTFRENEFEILVGATNRELSQSLMTEVSRTEDWAIVRQGSKIAIVADNKIDEAVAAFLELFAKDDNIYVPDGYREVHQGEYALDSITVNGRELRDSQIFYSTTSQGSSEQANRFLAVVEELYGYVLKAEPYKKTPVDGAVVFSESGWDELFKTGARVTDDGMLFVANGMLSSLSDGVDLLCDTLRNTDGKTAAFEKGFEAIKDMEGESNMKLADSAYLASLDAKAEEMHNAVLNAASDYTPGEKGRIFYVSADGNDKNDGMSEDTPIATIGGLVNLPIRAGDVVLFRRGDMFRGKFSAVGGVTYSAYGEGAKPTINGSVRNYADANLWKETDKENIYKFTGTISNVGVITFDHDPTHLGDYDVLFGKMRILGANLETYADLSADCEFYSDLSTGELYVYSAEGNPGSRFSDIEIGSSGNTINGGAGKVVIDNLHITMTGSHGVGAGTHQGLTVQNCVFDWLGGSILSGYGGANVTRYGNAVETYGGCNGYYVKNNWMYQIYDTGITHQFHDDPNATNHMANIEYCDNIIEYCFWSIEYYNCGCKYSDTKNVHIHDNFCRFGGEGWGCLGRETGAPMYSMGDAPDLTENYVTENNIFDRCLGWLWFHYGEQEEEGSTIFRNNTYVQNYGGRFIYTPSRAVMFDGGAEAAAKEIIGEEDPTIVLIMPEAAD